jgi:histidinol phosphatase-like enzyme
MKKISIILISTLFIVPLFSQNIFFATKEGMSLLYANKNETGKLENYMRQTIKKVEGSGENFAIGYVAQMLDKNRKPMTELSSDITYKVVVANGYLELDMRNFGAAGMEGLLEVSGDKIKIPTSLSVGDVLKDVKFTLTVNMGFAMNTNIHIYDQECIALEEITVPAGTYECYKVTQTASTEVLGKTFITKTTTWYAPNVGVVKTESYKENGKLQSVMELHEIK